MALKRNQWVVVGLDHWLVLGGGALVGNKRIQLPLHGLHQVFQIASMAAVKVTGQPWMRNVLYLPIKKFLSERAILFTQHH